MNSIRPWPSPICGERTGLNRRGCAGCLWNARWGTGQVVRYSPDGRVIDSIALPVAQTTCPAFGGDDMTTMFVTSATAGLSEAEIADVPDSGRTFSTRADAPGQAEHKVIL